MITTSHQEKSIYSEKHLYSTDSLKKNCLVRILYTTKMLFKNEDEIKMLPNSGMALISTDPHNHMDESHDCLVMPREETNT